MARPRRTIYTHLPDHVYVRLRTRKSGKVVKYYTYRMHGKTEIQLGTDYNHACIKAAQLNLEREHHRDQQITFTMIAKRFKNEILPTKKSSTAQAYLQLLTPLLHYFENAPLEQIEAQHIASYLKWRKETPATANNEYGLFNQIWGYAREWGYTNLPSPTSGVKRYKTNRRDFYVSDELYALIYQAATPLMQDLMDVAYLTGQRPIDIVSIERSQIQQGYLHITQQKTTAKVRFELTGKLAEIIHRRLQNSSDYLFIAERGGKLTAAQLGKLFRTIRNRVIKSHPEWAEQLAKFQFRDLRAKSGTDKAVQQGIDAARQQLGHTTAQMTQTYIRQALPIAPLLSTPTPPKEEN